jgi:ATP-dependent Clp protease ATP-binding subunit ClpA
MYSRYFELQNIERVFGDTSLRSPISYEAALALLKVDGSGYLRGLLSIPESGFIMNRLLIDVSDLETFEIPIEDDSDVPLYHATVTLGSLWKVAYEHSDELKTFLLSHKIQKEIYDDTCDWLDRILEEERRKSAWWWRENLSKIRGIAKSLSYGSAVIISRYARELGVGMGDVGHVLLHKEAVTHLEETLAKTRGANAVIVGSRGTGRHTIVRILSKMIEEGDCYSEIEHKRLFEFDNNVLGSLDAGELINVFGRCFEEAVINRNIIFVINDLPILYDMTQSKGVDIFQLIEQYINHPHISIICICDQPFYQQEAHKALFDRDFEVVHIEDTSSRLLIPYIQDTAIVVENATGTFFPAHSVNTIAGALNRYFIEESPLIKASDLMYKIATSSTGSQHIILDEESVSETIKLMTGIQTGEVQSEEKEKLLNLETILHKKVIGQNEAIQVIASTMRRSRAGLTSANKPIGSFLFLGPTGVGKTETAKVLADVFFGSESHMSRIDMNEYTMDNSSNRLLGDTNQEGDIAHLVHGRPYGVLLLDEFEKSTTDVKDIFLRALDEGVFTNGAGKLISVRTQIIIATSNAGSSFIQESGLNASSSQEEIETIKNKLIDAIVSEGLFRPELINRFDAVVLFHPLGSDSRVLIARKMLEALKERVLLQGYDVTFTDALVEKVAGSEHDDAFGGRAIQRNIQTHVEEALAKKIIDGSLQAGGSVTLDKDDI